MRIAFGIIFLLIATILLFAEKIVTERDLMDLLRSAWTSFLILGIVSILIEWQFRHYDRKERTEISARLNALGTDISRKFFESAKDPAIASALLRNSLQARIADKGLADSLSSFLAAQCSDEKYLLNARIFFRVQIGESDNYYRLTMRQTLELEHGQDSLVVAIVQNNPVIERIANYNPHIDVVLCPSDYAACIDNGDALKHVAVRARVLTQEGQKRVADIESVDVSGLLRKKIMDHSGLTDEQMRMVSLIKYSVPCDEQDRVEFEIETTFRMEAADNYNVWSADRVMWVDTIEFDFHEIAHKITNVALHLFLYNSEAIVSRRDSVDSRLIKINGWLLPGQGALIIWRWK